jgi:hypothetical protein
MWCIIHIRTGKVVEAFWYADDAYDVLDEEYYLMMYDVEYIWWW